MSGTLLAEYVRKAAHGNHRCGWCGENIAAGARYVDQRIADNSTVYTWRSHPTCDTAVYAWVRAEGLSDDDLEGRHPRDIYADVREWQNT